jgi:hypothetical protein
VNRIDEPSRELAMAVSATTVVDGTASRTTHLTPEGEYNAGEMRAGRKEVLARQRLASTGLPPIQEKPTTSWMPVITGPSLPQVQTLGNEKQRTPVEKPKTKADAAKPPGSNARHREAAKSPRKTKNKG